MTIKCTRGQPMRFLGQIGIQVNGGFAQVVGIECPDEKCRKHRVVESDVWIRSLQEAPGSATGNIRFNWGM